MKFLASIAVVILLICGGLLWFVAGGSLNEYVRSQIETVGSSITEQKVTVGKIDIKALEGAGSILALQVPNPANYKAPNALTLGEITLDINIESLKSSPIIIDAIIIKDVSAVAEMTSEGKANLKELLDTITKNTASGENPPKETTADKQEPIIAVSKVVLENTNLTVDLSALGNQAHSVSLPNINLTNIGGEEGLPASQLGAEITKQALSKVWQEAKNTQKEKLKDKAIEELKDKAKDKLKSIFN